VIQLAKSPTNFDTPSSVKERQKYEEGCMQITVLRYFLEVIEQGSVRGAAERMNITPSAISRHIGILERTVGAPLFERKPRGMALTVEGEILSKYAKRMVSNIDLVKSAVEEIKGLRRGVIRIFAIEAVASNILYPAIREFLSLHPGISFEVEVIARDNSDVLHALLRDEADIGIMYKLNLNPDIDYLCEFETPFSVIAAPDHPLALLSSLSVRDLDGHVLAGLSPSSATRRVTEEAMRSAGVKVDYTMTVNSFEMAKEFARTGVGVSVLPEIAVRREQEAGTLVAIPVTEWSLRHIRCAICTHSGNVQTKAAKAFLDTLRMHTGKPH
jgi:DNA-binding transcriptional LysR family regulator